MQGFIEVVSATNNHKVLLPISSITAVAECDGDTFIELGYDRKGRLTGITVENESYEDIKTKILNAR